MAVNAAVGNKPEEMQAAAAGLSERLVDDLVTGKLAVGNGFVDAGEVLVNDPARAEVKVSDLRVTHLPRREPDVHTRRAHAAYGVGPIQLIMKRGTGKQRRVAVSLRLLSSVGIDAPPIPDDQNHWLRHTGIDYGGRKMSQMARVKKSHECSKSRMPRIGVPAYFLIRGILRFMAFVYCLPAVLAAAFFRRR